MKRGSGFRDGTLFLLFDRRTVIYLTGEQEDRRIVIFFDRRTGGQLFFLTVDQEDPDGSRGAASPYLTPGKGIARSRGLSQDETTRRRSRRSSNIQRKDSAAHWGREPPGFR